MSPRLVAHIAALPGVQFETLLRFEDRRRGADCVSIFVSGWRRLQGHLLDKPETGATQHARGMYRRALAAIPDHLRSLFEDAVAREQAANFKPSSRFPGGTAAGEGGSGAGMARPAMPSMPRRVSPAASVTGGVPSGLPSPVPRMGSTFGGGDGAPPAPAPAPGGGKRPPPVVEFDAPIPFQVGRGDHPFGTAEDDLFAAGMIMAALLLGIKIVEDPVTNVPLWNFARIVWSGRLHADPDRYLPPGLSSHARELLLDLLAPIPGIGQSKFKPVQIAYPQWSYFAPATRRRRITADHAVCNSKWLNEVCEVFRAEGRHAGRGFPGGADRHPHEHDHNGQARGRPATSPVASYGPAYGSPASGGVAAYGRGAPGSRSRGDEGRVHRTLSPSSGWHVAPRSPATSAPLSTTSGGGGGGSSSSSMGGGGAIGAGALSSPMYTVSDSSGSSGGSSAALGTSGRVTHTTSGVGSTAAFSGVGGTSSSGSTGGSWHSPASQSVAFDLFASAAGQGDDASRSGPRTGTSGSASPFSMLHTPSMGTVPSLREQSSLRSVHSVQSNRHSPAITRSATGAPLLGVAGVGVPAGRRQSLRPVSEAASSMASSVASMSPRRGSSSSILSEVAPGSVASVTGDGARSIGVDHTAAITPMPASPALSASHGGNPFASSTAPPPLPVGMLAAGSHGSAAGRSPTSHSGRSQGSYGSATDAVGMRDSPRGIPHSPPAPPPRQLSLPSQGAMGGSAFAGASGLSSGHASAPGASPPSSGGSSRASVVVGSGSGGSSTTRGGSGGGFIGLDAAPAGPGSPVVTLGGGDRVPAVSPFAAGAAARRVTTALLAGSDPLPHTGRSGGGSGVGGV
jgi:hypothetical protein